MRLSAVVMRLLDEDPTIQCSPDKVRCASCILVGSTQARGGEADGWNLKEGGVYR